MGEAIAFADALRACRDKLLAAGMQVRRLRRYNGCCCLVIRLLSGVAAFALRLRWKLMLRSVMCSRSSIKLCLRPVGRHIIAIYQVSTPLASMLDLNHVGAGL